MKNLLLIRHAKSSWSNLSIKDFDRPLNDRGKHDAPLMGRRLKERKIFPDKLVSSTANRAISTAKLMCDELGYKSKNIIQLDELYHAEPSVFLKVISELDDDWNTVAIYSHNPGITSFVNELGVAMLDNMPTCGIFAVHAETKNWKDFAKAKKRFWFFDFPKNF